MTRKRAKDLRCGDIFRFRGRAYLCVSCVTMPTGVVIATCLPDRQDLSQVTALQLPVEYVVRVPDRSKMALHPINLSRAELSAAELAEIAIPDAELVEDDASLSC